MRYKLFVVIAAITFFASCREIKEVQCTGIKGFKVHKVNTEGINSEVLISIRNPNPFGFTIYQSEFNVSYAGIKLGKAKLLDKVKIAANKEETYPFALNADFKELSLSDILKLLESFTKKDELEVTGDLRVGKWFVKKSFPVKVKEKILTY